MQWTDDQYKAISAKDGTLLVSAAAGSGKTAVLVERVVSRLEDEVNGCNADELLIVTFTKAATAQMREKIEAALSKRIAENPGNTHLLRQKTLLPFAHISTIDSFCADIVRENFQNLGIEPDYKIADEHRMKLMREETAAEIVEQMYTEDDGVFSELCELLFRGRDDRKLMDTVIKLDMVASSYAEPERWLRSLYARYDPDVPLGGSDWGRLAAEQGTKILDTCIAVTDNALRLIEINAAVQDKYEPFLLTERAQFESLRDKLRSDDWNAVRQAVLQAPDDLPARCPPIKGDSFEKSVAQGAHKSNKERLQKKLAALYCTTAEEYAEDCAYCLPLIRRLSEAVLAYRAALLQKKKRENSYEFSDISHYALCCLRAENGEKSDYARELSEQFCEILVDEFQDVNQAQYELFQLLSKDGKNLFMVGDAKQSIYKFRQARPDIFISLKNRYPLYTDGNYPAVVQLDRNFRSRAGVTQWVNFAFSQLMYAENGEAFEVNYDWREYLRAAAVYPPTDSPQAELHAVCYDKVEDGRFAAEARYIAQWILKQLADGLTVTEEGETRKATFRDFCILLRSDNGNINLLAQTLLAYGIPARAGVQGGFFDAPEIQFMFSLLQVLDNPLQDVPLLSVMLSPVFGFTPDDLTALRVDDRRASLYALVVAAAKRESRYARFLQTLDDYRLISATVSSGEMIRRLLDETGYYAVAGAMSGGEGRQTNLRLLQSMAQSYEQTGKFGLSGFVRYLERMRAQGAKIETPSAPPLNADVVQIMTIHKSKGLEFPVCILANTAAAFNTDEYKNNYIYHNDYGMATLRRDSNRFAQFETVPKHILNSKVWDASLNEELRVLYVAMTRAKEKLVAVASVENLPNRLVSLAARCAADGSVSGVLEMTSYADMLLCTALRHPDAHLLRERAEIPSATMIMPADFFMHTVVADAPESLDVIPEPTLVPQESDPDIVELIRAYTGYVYPYAALAQVTAKHAASGMEQLGVNSDFFASSRPAFMSEGGLTPAQRGTVLHRFMQYADYPAAAEDVRTELERLCAEGIFSEQERDVLPVEAVQRFFGSEIGQRMLRSPEPLLREKRFAIEMPAKALYPNLPDTACGETVVVQGMVDCAFVEDGKLYILDYKTDREPPEVLRERYRTQLSVYKTAMAQCTDYPVGGALLYSFHNHCIIPM